MTTHAHRNSGGLGFRQRPPGGDGPGQTGGIEGQGDGDGPGPRLRAKWIDADPMTSKELKARIIKLVRENGVVTEVVR